MHNTSFAQPGTPGAQAQQPAVVPFTQPAPQQPVVDAQAATPNLLHPGAMTTQAQQTAAVTAAPLLGAGAGSQRNAPDSGFDQPIDGNDARTWAAPLGPQAPGQLQPQGFPWFQPAPLASSSSIGNMHVFGGHLNAGIASPDANGRFAANPAGASGWAPVLRGIPFHATHLSGAGAPPALISAVLHGDMRSVYSLLADPHTNVNIRDGMGYTALMHATAKGDLSLVFALLSRPDIDVHARGIDGRSALELAFNSGNVLTFQNLSNVIAARALAFGTPHAAHSLPPIFQAPFLPPAVNANVVFPVVLSMPAFQDEGATPALIHAVKNNDPRTIRALLAGPGINVNAKDERGRTALHHAVRKKNRVAVALLLAAKNIDVNASDEDGQTALHHAADRKCESAIVGRLLAAPGINRHARDKKGHTPFNIAVQRSATAIIRPLFASEVEAEGVPANTRLALAAAKGELAKVEALLGDPDIDVNAKSYGGNTALMLAVANGHEAVVRRLIAAPGIDVNAQDKNEISALYVAAENGSEGVLRSLLDAPNIDLNVNRYGLGTSLMAAALNGKEKAFLALLATPGVDIHVSETPAVIATVEAEERILGALLAMPGIDVNARAENGWNDKYWFPLNRAAYLGHEANVRLLLAMPDIDVNAIDGDSNTALLQAAIQGHETVVHTLLAMPGIRIDIADKNGNTALSIAMEKGHDAIVKALRGHVPAKPAEPATVLHLFQTIFTIHSGKPKQSASSSADIAPNPDAARKLDKLCESLQFGKCGAADVPALFTTAGPLPNGAHSALALALAFGFCTGHYRNADGALDEAIAAAVDKAGLRTSFDDTVEKLSLAAKHINLCRIDGMNLLGIAAKDGNERMIRGLVRMGAYVNAPSPNGKTALAIAVENRQWGACAELVFHGALPTLPLHDGYPALYHIVRDFNTDAHASESLALLIRYLRKKGVSFDILVKNPIEAMRAERPTVPLYELLVTNEQSWGKFSHILVDLQNAGPAVPAPTTTAAIPGNTLSSL